MRQFRNTKLEIRIWPVTIVVVALAVLAAPLPAEAQQPERMRRIGVLHYLQENDPEGRAYVSAFQQSLQQLGLTVDRNVRIDYRLTGGMPTAFGSTPRNWSHSRRT